MGGGGPRFEAAWLIVGLGNPGEEYLRHRHNVGFWVVNELARRAGTQPKATGSTMHIGVGTLAGERVALVKPKTFVNLSGKAVAQALQWTGCPIERTIVIYDELDLAAGAIRVRIGIGRPTAAGEPSWDPEVVARWVLGPPTGDDKRVLDDAVIVAADAVEAVLRDGAEAAGSKFNRK